MKRTKLFGVFAIVLALFAFAGCDAILEAFYPEFAEGQRGGEFAIGLWAEIIIPGGQGLPGGDPMIGAKAVNAWGSESAPVAEAYMYPNWGENEHGDTVFSAYIELFIAEPGDYRVVVWGESDGNKKADWNEPQADAVWWHPDSTVEGGGFEDNIFSFFEGSTFGNWLDGWVNIFTGEGGPPNYQFKVKGPFIIDEDRTDNFVFNVDAADENRNFVELSWSLWTDDYSSNPAGEWLPITGDATNSTTFTLRNDDIPEAAGGRLNIGWYWIEVEVQYEDGTWRFKRFPLRVVNEASAGASYDMSVEIWGVNGDPMFLPFSESYDVRLRLYGNSGEIFEGRTTTLVTSSNTLVIDTPTFSYNATDFTDAAGDGRELLEFAIDINRNGNIDGGDFQRVLPIGLDQADVTGDGTIYFFLDAWDLYPVFEDQGAF